MKDNTLRIFIRKMISPGGRITGYMLLFCLLLFGAGPAGLHAQAPSQVTFGVVTDVQYCPCETGGQRHYRASLGKLQEAVNVFNRRDLDFVIHLGDFIDRDFASYDTVRAIYNQVKAHHYQVYGNHDFNVAPDKKVAVPDLLGLDTLGTGEGYYQFSKDGWRFVVLNGTDISTYAHGESTVSCRRAQDMMAALRILGAPQTYEWNGGIGAVQLAWLDQVLSAADSLGQHTILFCHFPVFPNEGYDLYNDDQVLHLIDRHSSVAAYFAGHHHAGSYGIRKGVYYVTFHGMVNTEENAFAVVTLTPDTLRIDGFGREPDRTLPLAPGREGTE